MDVAEKSDIMKEVFTLDYIAVRKMKMLFMFAEIEQAYLIKISFTNLVFTLYLVVHPFSPLTSTFLK